MFSSVILRPCELTMEDRVFGVPSHWRWRFSEFVQTFPRIFQTIKFEPLQGFHFSKLFKFFRPPPGICKSSTSTHQSKWSLVIVSSRPLRFGSVPNQKLKVVWRPLDQKESSSRCLGPRIGDGYGLQRSAPSIYSTSGVDGFLRGIYLKAGLHWNANTNAECENDVYVHVGKFVDCSAFAEAVNQPYINVLHANSIWCTDSRRIAFGCLPNVCHTAKCCLPRLRNTSTSNVRIVFACRDHVLFAFWCKCGFKYFSAPPNFTQNL